MRLEKKQRENLNRLLAENQERLSKLEEILNIKFKNKLNLLIACMHASFSNEKGIEVNNEKLEFLGDAVLSLIVSEHLFKSTRKASEGELAKAKSVIASEKVLSEFAESLGLGEFLLLGKGALKEERGKRSNMADFAEAIIGAIFVDKGYKSAKKFVHENLLKSLTEIDFVRHDPKSALQELAVKKFHALPKYRIISFEGPAHARKFVCAALLREKVIGIGEGSSKKEAEKKAALSALQNLGVIE